MTAPAIKLKTDSRWILPGETLGGTVVLTAPDRWTARSATIHLGWVAFNVRRRQVVEVFREDLLRPGSPVDQRASLPFRIPVPLMPWSFAGADVTIYWFVKAQILPRGGRKGEVEVDLVVSPTGSPVVPNNVPANLHS